jgi:hypothetical protein
MLARKVVYELEDFNYGMKEATSDGASCNNT